MKERSITMTTQAVDGGGEVGQKHELEALIEAYGRRFVNRTDWYALQRENGAYTAFHRPLTPQMIVDHLRGKITLGVYALDQASRARWVCFDADEEAAWNRLCDLAARLLEQGMYSYLEDSRRGGHLWLFFGEPLAGRTARAFARALLDGQGTIEIFPKQDRVGEGPGSLVRLPLGVHRKDGKRHPVRSASEDGQGRRLREQLALLAEARTIPTLMVANTLAEAALPTHRPNRAYPQVKVGEGAIDRIKRGLDIFEFVSQHVPLTTSGRGHCPLHDDAHASFSVNRRGQYWHCFAGCGGGDVIVFWERYRGITRAQAVRELAQMLKF